MRKQKLLFFPFLLGLGVILLSCDFGDSGNSETWQSVPAVVWESYLGDVTVGVAGSFLSAPSLTDVYDGDCIWMYQFVVDYDNQPSGKYTTVTEIIKDNINQKVYYDINYLIGDPADPGEYTLSLTNVGGWADPYYDGRFFVVLSCKDRNPTVRLIYDPEEEGANGVKTFYLQAMPSSSSPESSNVQTIHVFNLKQIISIDGSQSTYTIPGTTNKEDITSIKIDLNYFDDGVRETAVNMLSENRKSLFEVAFFNN